MPVLGHLLELRRRLMWSLLALALAFAGCYWLAPDIVQFLARPLANSTGHAVRMISTAPQDIFIAYLKVAFWAAACLSFPIIASQVWIFVAPGMYRHEKRAFLPFLLATPVLFALGAALVYWVVLPLALTFFFSFEVFATANAIAIENEPRLKDYLSLAMSMMFAFGLCFQLPVLLTLLAKAGFIKASSLAEQRRFVVVGIFIVAAILTPPDVVSQCSLALPLLALYEISIVLVRWVTPKTSQDITP